MGQSDPSPEARQQLRPQQIYLPLNAHAKDASYTGGDGHGSRAPE